MFLKIALFSLTQFSIKDSYLVDFKFKIQKMLKKHIRKILLKVGFYYPIISFIEVQRSKKKMDEWIKSDKPLPPVHLYKQKVLLEYSKKFRLTNFVETGTYVGEMVEAMRKHFEQIYSIELNDELYAKANNRFQKIKNVEIIKGNSGVELFKLMSKIDSPTLFWLDGHYSGIGTAKGILDTPIYQELEAIFTSKIGGHVIIIDDARCFGSDNSYPSILELTNFIRTHNPNHEIFIDCDSIRVSPI